MSWSWRKGSTRRWRSIRLRVLIRDGWLCKVRGPGCTYGATTVHHTRGRAVTGDDERYLVAACATCNGKIGDPRKTNPQPRRVTRW